MRHLKWVTALELDRWADTNEARSLLPEFLRRLVHATVEKGDLQDISFPGGDESHRPGYDGVTVTKIGNEKVPAGTTYWEMGTNIGVKAKLDEDYDKRIQNRGEGDFSPVTYIAVTPRDYQTKGAWAAEKRKLNQWKDVRVYDSDDLEQWFETGLAAAIWAARYVSSNRPEGLQDLSAHWENIQKGLKQKLPPKALLVSRQQATEAFKRWLDGSPDILAVHGQSPQEVVDVFTAWAVSLERNEQDAVASRAVVVEQVDAWRAIVDSKQRLILICSERLDLTSELLAEAWRKGHHVLRPISSIRAQSGNVVHLDRMNRVDLEKVLRDAGIAEQEAFSLAQQCGGSFAVLKRRLSAVPVDKVPAWASPPASEGLAPLLLAGAWRDTVDGDKAIIEKLSERSYSQARSIANRWHTEPDAPLWWSDGIWEFVSPLDSWSFLYTALSPIQLDLWEAAAKEVLGTNDPRLELPADERFLANIKGKTLAYSSELRQGFARSLALIATRSPHEQVTDTIPLEARVERIVRAILPPEATWQRWASLGSLLPLIAEAAPTAILDAAEAGVRGSDPELPKLFREEGGSFTSRAEHTGLLWALERLGWSKEFLPRTAIVLAKLDELDPGGRIANRPKASLRDLFFSWMPHTTAPLRERLEIIRLLLRRHPMVGWSLLVQLLPNRHESIMVHSTPEWRFWAEGWKRDITRTEYRDTVNGLIDLALEVALTTPERWVDLIDELASLPSQGFQRSLAALEAMDQSKLGDDSRRALWDKIATLVNRHTYFASADWALPRPFVERLATVRDKLQPTDTIAVAAPLFEHGYEFTGDMSMSWEVQEENRRKKRVAAIKSVIEQTGFAGIRTLAESAKDVWGLGILIAQNWPTEFEADILPGLLCCGTKNVEMFAGTYVAQRAFTGREWAEKYLLAGWTDAEQGAFLAQLSFERRTWDFIHTFSSTVQLEYWRRTQHVGAEMPPVDVEFAASNLLNVQRPSKAVLVLRLNRKKQQKLPVLALIALLERVAITSPGEEGGAIDPYHVQELLKEIQKDPTADETRVAKLEWAYLPILNEHTLLPHTLHRLLSKDPKFFYELLELIYIPRNEPSEEKPTLDDRRRAHLENAWRLLHEWVRIPGARADGTVDAGELLAWVQRARELAVAGNRIEVCDITIGGIFANSKPEPDGSWPCIAIREVFEEVDSRELERGFMSGVRNSRGTYTKAINEGGTQERDLAAKYEKFAEASLTRWPRTAAALMSVAASYRDYAKHEDHAAERRKL